jgi:hypothetical protein
MRGLGDLRVQPSLIIVLFGSPSRVYAGPNVANLVTN